MRFPFDIAPLRREKCRKLEPILRSDMPVDQSRGKFDFLSEELRAETRITETENISSHDYDEGPWR